MNVKPNLFIVGAAKSGTTSLWSYFKEHPQIFMPYDELSKEPSYFSQLNWMSSEQYFKLFATADTQHKYVGEASTAYLTDLTSAARLHAFNPNSKIIIVLRNPVQRAYSLYCYMVQEGYEYASTFEQALELEALRRSRRSIPNWFEPQYYWNYMYYASGLYFEQVRRYLDLFHGNVLIMKFESLIASTDTELHRLCDFLDVQYIQTPLKKENPSTMVQDATIQFILRKITNSWCNGELGNGSFNSAKLASLIIDCEIKMEYITSYGEEQRAFIRRLLPAMMMDLKNLHSGFATKKDRDVLLKLGMINNKPPAISLELKKRLAHYYVQDIEAMTETSILECTDWLHA